MPLAANHHADADPAAVLARATLKAAELLALRNADLARIVGVSEATVSRWRRGQASLDAASKAGELAILLIRVFRALDPLVGSDGELRKAWMRSRNDALNGIPAELVQKPDGLVRTLAYLDGMRAAA